MKMTIVAWGSELLQFSDAAREAGIDLSAWQLHELRDEPEKRRYCIEACRGSDVVLAHPSSDPVWNEILGGLAEAHHGEDAPRAQRLALGQHEVVADHDARLVEHRAPADDLGEFGLGGYGPYW